MTKTQKSTIFKLTFLDFIWIREHYLLISIKFLVECQKLFNFIQVDLEDDISQN